jgi:fumarate hydratase, class II
MARRRCGPWRTFRQWHAALADAVRTGPLCGHGRHQAGGGPGAHGPGLLDEERGGGHRAGGAGGDRGPAWDDQFVVDPFQAGAGTSHNMNTNEVIANRANQILGYALDDARSRCIPNDHVNMAQSTNDTIPTAIRLGCLWRLGRADGRAGAAGRRPARRPPLFDDVVKSGRTHLQDAVPVRLGQEFGAYARAVERDAGAHPRARRGAAPPGHRRHRHGQRPERPSRVSPRMVQKLSELTGLELYESDNLFESMQSMADAVDFSAACAPSPAP